MKTTFGNLAIHLFFILGFSKFFFLDFPGVEKGCKNGFPFEIHLRIFSQIGGIKIFNVMLHKPLQAIIFNHLTLLSLKPACN